MKKVARTIVLSTCLVIMSLFIRSQISQTMISSAAVKYYLMSGGYVGFDASKGRITSVPKTIGKIPSTVGGKKVKIIGRYAFQGCSKLKKAVIPSSVKKIENGAFYKCSGIKSVTIPKKVKSIGEYSFGYCKKLSKVIFKKGSKAKFKCNEAFFGSTKIKTVSNNPNSTWKKRITSEKKALKKLQKIYKNTPEYFLSERAVSAVYDISSVTKEQWDVIKTKAEKITKGCKTQYEKAKAVDKWVENYLCYDYDKIANDGEREQNPYKLLTWKKSEHHQIDVCTDCIGYSILTYALLREVNVPSVILYYISDAGGVRHAWNAICCDGKWIWTDATETKNGRSFFDAGTAGIVCDDDHSRIDQINRTQLSSFGD